MILTTSAATAPIREVGVTGQIYRLQEFIGQAPTRGVYVEGNEANGNALPQGFLVFQPPGSITQPHFHETNQFQVFVGGDGKFGKKAAAPVTVQYASGHTPYGPIAAGADGVVYYTLRQRWDPGAKYMPKMRDLLVRGRQRQALVTLAPDVLETFGTTVLIEPHDDGLMACVVRLHPNETYVVDHLIAGGGQYHVVLEGELVFDGERFPKRSCQFATSDAQDPSITAGAQGLAFLILRFPKS